MSGCSEVECEGVPQGLLSHRVDKIDEMGFVGLTEEYSLSVCLWHTRFGGDCSNIEFDNFRPGTNHTKGGYNTSNFTAASIAILLDEETVYEKAKARFWR